MDTFVGEVDSVCYNGMSMDYRRMQLYSYTVLMCDTGKCGDSCYW